MRKIPRKQQNCSLRIAVAKISYAVKNPYNRTDPGSFILFTDILGRAIMGVNVHYSILKENNRENYMKSGNWNALESLIKNDKADQRFFFGIYLLYDGNSSMVEYSKVSNEFETTNYLLQFKMFVIVPKVALAYRLLIRHTIHYYALCINFSRN